MLKYFFGHGKIKLPWDSIHFSYLRSRLILYLGHLKGRVQQEDQYLFKTILSGRMVSIENEERTSLADLLQRCRLGTVNMFIKEERNTPHISDTPCKVTSDQGWGKSAALGLAMAHQ